MKIKTKASIVFSIIYTRKNYFVFIITVTAHNNGIIVRMPDATVNEVLKNNVLVIIMCECLNHDYS